MPTQSFSLQLSNIAGRKSHHIATEESKHPQPHPNAQWQRYKLTVDGERLIEVVITDKMLPRQVFSLERHAGQAVKVHSITMILNGKWRPTSSTNDAVRELINFMRQAMPVPQLATARG